MYKRIILSSFLCLFFQASYGMNRTKVQLQPKIYESIRRFALDALAQIKQTAWRAEPPKSLKLLKEEMKFIKADQEGIAGKLESIIRYFETLHSSITAFNEEVEKNKRLIMLLKSSNQALKNLCDN